MANKNKQPEISVLVKAYSKLERIDQKKEAEISKLVDHPDFKIIMLPSKFDSTSDTFKKNMTVKHAQILVKRSFSNYSDLPQRLQANTAVCNYMVKNGLDSVYQDVIQHGSNYEKGNFVKSLDVDHIVMLLEKNFKDYNYFGDYNAFFQDNINKQLNTEVIGAVIDGGLKDINDLDDNKSERNLINNLTPEQAETLVERYPPNYDRLTSEMQENEEVKKIYDSSKKSGLDLSDMDYKYTLLLPNILEQATVNSYHIS